MSTATTAVEKISQKVFRNNPTVELSLSKREKRMVMSYMYVAVGSLFIGGLMGLLQVLARSGEFELPWGMNYYTILTVHGVLLGLIMTSFFIMGFQNALMGKTVGFSKKQLNWAWVGFWVKLVGTIMASITILIGKASVLYTFYTPLQAHPAFYIGITLVVVGSWITAGVNFRQFYTWKKANPDDKSPLLAFMVVINMLMWCIATIGVATSMLVEIIPWSLGYKNTINVLLSRTLFWYFGHPLVYFWLLPAYMAWYAIIPKIIGGKIFSDTLARFSFILFLFFSIPVGLHHQLTEPGLDTTWKFIQVALTFMVVIPSLMTAFSMFATFEITGRKKGYGGLFGWLKHLPWKDVRFLAPFVGMLAFIPGGAGGIINASYQINTMVHNTIWVPGHFHLAAATTVMLTFFGISYWLIPHLTGRKLTKSVNNLGIFQTILWSVGMLIMSTSMHIQGLTGAPRRSDYSDYGGTEQAVEWGAYQMSQAIGGSILFIAILLSIYIFIKMAFFSPKGEEEFPIAQEEEDAEPTPRWTENWKLWIAITLVLILFAYSVPVMDVIQNAPPGSPPFDWPIGNT